MLILCDILPPLYSSHWLGATAEEQQEVHNLLTLQTIEVKKNDAYSTIHQIPAEDNVAYITSQVTPQIPTEDNVAYGRIVSEDDYAIVSDPNAEYDYVS